MDRKPICPTFSVWKGYWLKLEPWPWHQHLGRREIDDEVAVWQRMWMFRWSSQERSGKLPPDVEILQVKRGVGLLATIPGMKKDTWAQAVQCLVSRNLPDSGGLSHSWAGLPFQGCWSTHPKGIYWESRLEEDDSCCMYQKDGGIGKNGSLRQGVKG